MGDTTQIAQMGPETEVPEQIANEQIGSAKWDTTQIALNKEAHVNENGTRKGRIRSDEAKTPPPLSWTEK